MVWTAPVRGSGTRGSEPRCCIEGRDCDKYIQLFASEEGLCLVELIASNNFDNCFGQNPQIGYIIISFNEGVPESL